MSISYKIYILDILSAKDYRIDYNISIILTITNNVPIISTIIKINILDIKTNLITSINAFI